jgi:Cation transporter/ATPase, N-terminus
MVATEVYLYLAYLVCLVRIARISAGLGYDVVCRRAIRLHRPLPRRSPTSASQDGPNELPQRKAGGFLHIVLGVLREPMILLVVLAGAVAYPAHFGSRSSRTRNC